MIGGAWESTSAGASRFVGSFSGFDRETQQQVFHSEITDQLGGSHKGTELATHYEAAYQAAFVESSASAWANPLNTSAESDSWNASWSQPEIRELRSQMIAKYGPEVVPQYDRDLGAEVYMNSVGASSESAALIHSWDRARPE